LHKPARIQGVERLEGGIARVTIAARLRPPERQAWPPARAKRVRHIPNPDVGIDGRGSEATPLVQSLDVPFPLALTSPRDRSRRPPVRGRRSLRETRGIAMVTEQVRVQPETTGTQRHRAHCTPRRPRGIAEVPEHSGLHAHLPAPE